MSEWWLVACVVTSCSVQYPFSAKLACFASPHAAPARSLALHAIPSLFASGVSLWSSHAFLAVLAHRHSLQFSPLPHRLPLSSVRARQHTLGLSVGPGQLHARAPTRRTRVPTSRVCSASLRCTALQPPLPLARRGVKTALLDEQLQIFIAYNMTVAPSTVSDRSTVRSQGSGYQQAYMDFWLPRPPNRIIRYTLQRTTKIEFAQHWNQTSDHRALNALYGKSPPCPKYLIAPSTFAGWGPFKQPTFDRTASCGGGCLTIASSSRFSTTSQNLGCALPRWLCCCMRCVSP